MLKNLNSAIGKTLQDGEVLFREGASGKSMFVVLEGQLEIYKQDPNYGEIHLEIRSAGDIVGITSFFSKKPRSLSARALGKARVLTIDKLGLMRQIQEDFSIGLHLFERLSRQIKVLTEKLVRHNLLFQPALNDDLLSTSLLVDKGLNLKRPIISKLSIAFLTLIAISITSFMWVSAQYGKESHDAIYQQTTILVLSDMTIFVILFLFFGKSLNRAQKHLRSLSDNLVEMNSRYRRQIENLREKHFLFSMDGTMSITYVSPAITNVLGYSQKDFIGHSSKYITKSAINLKARKNFRARVTQTLIKRFLCEFYHKNGDARILEVEMVPIPYADGRVMSWEGIAHDVTNSHDLQNTQERIIQSYLTKYRGLKV